MLLLLRPVFRANGPTGSLLRLFNTKSILDEVKASPEVFKHNLSSRKIKIDIDRILQLAQTSGSSKELWKLLKALPNLSHSSVAYATEPIELEEFGQKKNTLKTRLIEYAHYQGLLLRGTSYTTICGERTYFLTGDLARLERALVRFTLDRLKKHNFKIISVPDLLAPHQIEDCGVQVQGQRSQIYKVNLSEGRDFCLSGTSEHALANLYREKDFDESELPLKLGAVSRCFRAEVSTLKEEKGLYRVHQFTKVEMFGFTEGTIDKSQELQREFVELQKSLFQELGLHCKVLDMPPIDLGRSTSRKIDIEAWMSGHRFYGEISSTSDCTDFQSSRLGITCKGKLVHTVNGTACAIPRMLIAIGETHFSHHRIVIPEALRPYMGGLEEIRAQPSCRKWKKLSHYYLENRGLLKEEDSLSTEKLEDCG